jgi:hypothetical protein
MLKAAFAKPGSAAQSAEAALPAMVEVDLLPQWYPLLLTRRRRLMLQAWLTGLLVLALIAVLVWRRANEEATQVELASLEQQRRVTDVTLSALVVEEARLTELMHRAQLVARMGLPLEVSRILSEIDAAMPADVALTTFDAVVEERAVPVRGAILRGPTPARTTTQRSMRFTFTGFAATPESVVSLSRRLQEQPLLRDVTPARTQTTQVYGRPALLFEMSFRVDLAAGGGALAQAGGGA